MQDWERLEGLPESLWEHQRELAVERRHIDLEFLEDLGRHDEGRIVNTEFEEDLGRGGGELREFVNHAELEGEEVKLEVSDWLGLVDKDCSVEEGVRVSVVR